MRRVSLILAATLLTACNTGGQIGPSALSPNLAQAAQNASGKVPAVYDPGSIYMTPDPRLAMQMIVKVTGKPLGFKTPAQEQAYIDSLSIGLTVAQYDPEGYLANLEITGIKGAGRNDDSFVHAVRLTNYEPGKEAGSPNIWIQDKMFEKLLNNREAFEKVKNTVGKAVDAPALRRKDWTKPLPDKQQSHPTGETPMERYPDALKGIPNNDIGLEWHDDFHGGLPGEHVHEGAGFGTYAIAKAMGFTTIQATKFGKVCNGVDFGQTPYGSTGPTPTGALDRHFNFNPGGQDSRLIFARKHLEKAIAFGRKSAFGEAETELGVGLHSLQDLFAHAQSSTSVHATMGDFLDEPQYSPVGLVEATVATRNYLKAYLKGITATSAS